MSETQKLFTYVGSVVITLVAVTAHSVKNVIFKRYDEEQDNVENLNDSGKHDKKTFIEENNIEVTTANAINIPVEVISDADLEENRDSNNIKEVVGHACSIATPMVLVTCLSFCVSVPLVGGWALATMDLDCTAGYS
jgi:hypothetical protein